MDHPATEANASEQQPITLDTIMNAMVNMHNQFLTLNSDTAALRARLSELETAAVQAHQDVQAQANAAAAEALQAQDAANAAGAEALQAQDAANVVHAEMASQSRDNAPPATPAPEAAVQSRVFTPLKPPTYHGKLNEDPAEWLFQCSQFFNACDMPKDKQVPYAAAFLRDNAATWWRIQVQAANAGKFAHIQDWSEFGIKLAAQYQRPNLVKTLRDKLANLQQLKSVHEFIAQLQAIAVQIPDLSEGELLDRFVRGLKPAIRREVELRDSKSLEEAMRLAERADTVEYRMRNVNSQMQRPKYSNAYKPVNYRLANAGPSQGPVPMELGALPMNHSTAGHAGSERSRDYGNIVCWGCGKKGHPRRLCKEPKNARRQ